MILKNITKKINNRTLFENLSLEISNGILEIKGPSGCGKTTLINIIQGIDKDFEGEVIFSDNEKVITYIGQETSLLEHLSLRKNLEYFNKSYSIPKFEELVKTFYFQKYIETPIKKLSGGERAKAELIFLLLSESNIYILDEPLSSLDKYSKKLAIEYINNLEGIVILINHDEEDASFNISKKIEFKNGNFTIFNFNEKEEDLKKYLKKDKINIFKIITSSFFKHSYLDVFMKFLLSTSSLILFTLGIYNIDLSSDKEKDIKALNSDPFNQHLVYINNTSPLDLKDVSNKNIKVDEVFFFNTLQDQIPFVSCDFDENNIYYFSNNNDIFINNDVITVNNIEYTFKKINKDDEILKKTELPKIMKVVIDGFKDPESNLNTFALVNSNFINDVIIQGGPNKIEFDKFSNPFLSMPSLKLIGKNLALSYDEDSNIKIIEKNERSYHLLVSGFGRKEKISIYDNSNKIILNQVVTDTLLTEKYNIEMNLTTYKELLLHSKNPTNAFQKYSNYYLNVDKENIIKLYDISTLKINSLIRYEIFNFLYDIEKYLPYFVASLVTVFIFIIYLLLSKNRNKKWTRNLYSVLEHKQCTKKEINKNMTRFLSLLYGIPLITINICYPILLFTVKNKSLYASYIDNPISMPYSEQPYNPYYDKIDNFINFYNFEYLILLSVIIFLSYVLINYLIVQKNLKKINK